ncbi:putative zinc finger CCCH domain-containing protein 51 [Phragmites australis]|uniref:putative zinc finger CCCH domain-containing protein 51 n=1 Tax=Phragmites australis TaxID=29695 RepID=UPI002D76FD57|nr:putative zinc finger CCCH domain-containing protein 51 [Phragmites australis]
MGCCKKGEDCRFSHESGFPEMHNKRQVHTLESLPMLEKEIRELLFSLQPPRVPIESLASIYIERYGKPLRVEGFGAEGQQHGKAYYNLIGLLLRLNTTRVIERQGQHYIVPVEDAPKFLADDFKLVMPSAIYDSNKIYITFEPKSTFSKQDAWNYFSRYGPVHDVRIPLRQKRMFGYVSFLKLAQEDAHSNSGSHQLSDANVIYEHHTGESISSHRELFREKLNDERDLGIVTVKSSVNNVPEMASPPTHNLPVHSVNKAGPLLESSHVSDRLDDAPATQDCDDYGLPENLDDIYL